jgi:methylenetetrahydrofolate dehydrogenase (NADP+)/methenyltetrahydrofolate cyclohydrolase
MKHAACEEAGIVSTHVDLAATSSADEVLAATQALVADDSIDGVLVQLPLPGGLDPEPVLLAIPPSKDVDGYHPCNLGAIAGGLHGVASCTPAGVIRMLDAEGVKLDGAQATVVGRSRTVGMPMALLLLERDATVTVAHKHTRDLASATITADVLVVAAGVPGLITADMVKPGAVVIDVGTTKTADGLRGDVAFDEVSQVASKLSPVPGGVGPMTIATLLATTVDLAEARVAQ